MPEKRRTRATKVQRTATQTTLKDHFQRTNSGVGLAEQPQDVHVEHTDSVAPSPQAADSRCSPEQPFKPPKPSRLFPIFTKVCSERGRLRDAVVNVDDEEVIDITDASDDMDLSTEPPLSSTRPLSPYSGSGHATSPSPPPPPTVLHDLGCGSDTSFPHVGTHEDTHMHKTSKIKESDKRIMGLGDIAPLPSSCSQHVRGLQHPYAFTRAPLKRSAFSSVSPPADEGTLDFLARWRQVDDIPSPPMNLNYQTLTPQQCEKDLQSLSRDYMDSHPAFARISSHREKDPLYRAETWTRRFRPRRANEVLGNEQHAIYLRDWLSALELQSQERQPGMPAGESKKNGPSKRVEPRGVKRPRVIRAVTRKRANKKRKIDSDDDLDDFVVFSDGDEGQADDPLQDSEDELAFCQRTSTRLHRCDAINALDTCPAASNTPTAEMDRTTTVSQKPAQTNFIDNLTNTLLITGPPGCGKTAAVYACAEELGWEIFEVYPGIGKRSGANLDHLVGDVGRNHIVQTVKRRAPPKTTKLEVKERVGLRSYLATGKTGRLAGSGKPSEEAGTEEQPINVEGASPTHEAEPLPPDEETVSPNEECHEGSGSIVGQSLVLLEEVDILFKEDAGFWPAVIEFIQCCQRPVVMTCNDVGLVPVGDLPLQKVLVFEPCPSTVAATFLQCLSLREGLLVPREDLMALYESTHTIDGLDVPDGPLYPRTGPLPLPDLRRCITQLQMECAGARHGSTSEMHQGDEAEGHVRRSARPISAASRVTAVAWRAERELWLQMKRQAELMSHVDAELRRTAMGRQETVGDEAEEVGYVGLCLARGGEGLEYYERDELIAEEAIRHSRGGHEEDGTGPMEASINATGRLTREEARGFRARVEYQSRMVYALQDILGPAAPLVPQRSVFLDYIPWVRYMVATDDVLERRAWEEMAGRGRAGRCTRNSMRTRHARTVALGEGQRAALMGEAGLFP